MFMPDVSWVEVGQRIKRDDEFAGLGPLQIASENGQREIPVGGTGVIHSSDGHYINIQMDDGFIFHMLVGDFVAFFKPVGKNETVHDKEEMIQDRHPDLTPSAIKGEYEFTLRNNEGYEPIEDTESLRYIGYWYRVKGDGWPNPNDYIDEEWDESERELVARYLESGRTLVYWKGFSWCRCGCHDDTKVSVPGTRCLTDGKWVWPEGFTHYIREHSVRPPAEFIEHVIRSGRDDEEGSDREAIERSYSGGEQ